MECPICGEGMIHRQVELSDDNTVLLYSVCDSCKSEFTTSRDSVHNVIERYLDEMSYDELRMLKENLKVMAANSK